MKWYKYPVLRVLLVFLGGFFVGNSVSIEIFILIGVLLMLFVFLATRQFATTTLIVLFYLAGNFHLKTQLSNSWQVIEVQTNHPESQRFIVQHRSSKILFQTYSCYNEIYSGSMVQFNGSFKDLPIHKDLSAFDYGSYLRSQGVIAIWQEGKRNQIKISNEFIHIRGEFERFRNAIINKTIEVGVLKSSTLGLFFSILLGDKSYLNKSQKDLFRTFGIAHVLAISGLHVGTIYLLLIVLVQHVFRLPKYIQNVIVPFVLIVYACLAGLPISAIRAVVMFLLLFYGKQYTRVEPINILLFTFLMMMVWERKWLWDVGFQLSFIAVFGIYYLGLPMQNKLYAFGLPNWLSGWLSINLSAFLFTAPILLFHFGEINWMALPLSCIIVPIISIFMYLSVGWMVLLNFGVGLNKIGFVLNLICDLIAGIVDFTEKEVGESLFIQSFFWLEVIGVYWMIIWLFSQKNWKLKWPFVFGFLLLFVVPKKSGTILFRKEGVQMLIDHKMFEVLENQTLKITPQNIVVTYQERVCSITINNDKTTYCWSSETADLDKRESANIQYVKNYQKVNIDF